MLYDYRADTRSVYIHWPFCPYRCRFCPFVALASHDEFMTRYHHALIKEIELFGQKCVKKGALETVFIGGGTPSTYPDDLLLDTFAKLKGMFDISDGAEVSIEVNPGTVRPEQLALWQKVGINRISIGVQSLDDAVLHKLNRLQSAHDVKVLLDRAAGRFDNISVDLILGLPGVVPRDWKRLLAQVVTWPIKHVSIYFLTVHEDTRLYFDVQTKKVLLPTDDSLIDLYHWSICYLERYDFKQYETSNFARPGYECKHNNAYWDRQPYKGFGLGACSFDGKSRFQNQKNLVAYLEGAQKGTSVVAFSEKLTDEQINLEKVMLGLRQSRGIARDELFRGLSVEQRRKLANTITMLQRRGYLREKAGRLVLTREGLVIQNEVAVTLSI